MTRDQRNALLVSQARATLAPLEAQRAEFWRRAFEAVEDELHRLIEENRERRVHGS